MTPQLTVYYDGLCRICATEIEHYQRHSNASRVRWVDLSLPEFDAKAEGLDREAANFRLHARRKDGTWLTGVDSFVAIWETLGTFAWLRKLVGIRALRPAFDLGYEGFARIRPYLPKRSRGVECDSGVCAPKRPKRKSGGTKGSLRSGHSQKPVGA